MCHSSHIHQVEVDKKICAGLIFEYRRRRDHFTSARPLPVILVCCVC
jgi:hypothetical protein